MQGELLNNVCLLSCQALQKAADTNPLHLNEIWYNPLSSVESLYEVELKLSEVIIVHAPSTSDACLIRRESLMPAWSDRVAKTLITSWIEPTPSP